MGIRSEKNVYQYMNVIYRLKKIKIDCYRGDNGGGISCGMGAGLKREPEI